MILSRPQKNTTDFQDCTRNEQSIAHLEWKHSEVSITQKAQWKADTRTTEPAPADLLQ